MGNPFFARVVQHIYCLRAGSPIDGDFGVNPSSLGVSTLSTVLSGPAAASLQLDTTVNLGLGVLIGLLGIALAIFFGFRTFTGGIRDHLRDIKTELALVRQKLDDIWDLRPWGGFGASPAAGTVHRKMEHLGSVSISARPGPTTTEYRVEIEKPLIRQGLIVKLAKETGFVDKVEKSLLDDLPRITELSSRAFLMHIPSTDSRLATEYMTRFLEWLDSDYIRRIDHELDDFEKPILADRG